MEKSKVAQNISKPKKGSSKVQKFHQKQNKTYKIFVGGLPSNTTKKELEAYFSHFGSVKSCKPKMWKYDPTRCKGFAILIVGNVNTYKSIFEEEKHIFSGREIECKKVLNKKELDSYSKNLFLRKIHVRGIPHSTTSEDLKEVFSQFGEVEIAYVCRDKNTEISLGFGYVTFCHQDTRNVVTSRKNVIIDGKVAICYPYNNDKYEEKNKQISSSRLKLKNEYKGIINFEKKKSKLNFNYFFNIKL